MVITIALLVTILVLLGVGIMLQLANSGFSLAATPTSTATARPSTTPSPDRRATHVAEDMLTQVAYAATVVAISQAGGNTAAFPSPPAGGPTVIFGQLTGTPGSNTVLLPFVPNGGALATAASSALTPLPTSGGVTISVPLVTNPVATPAPLPGQPTPAPVLPPGLPTPAPTPIVIVPTPTPTLFIPTPVVPTPEPPTATPTPSVFVVSQLNAFNRNANTDVRIGPGTVYSVTATLAPNAQIQLRGRDLMGDWIFFCCINNEQRWIRRAFLNINGNSLPPNAPTGADANDVRWLPVQPLDPTLPPQPIATPPQGEDFPLARYDRGNTNRVPFFPTAPLASNWPNNTQASQGFVSGLTVFGDNVLAMSNDSHLYSLGRQFGNQRWRYQLEGTTTFPAAIQDSVIYLAYAGVKVIALTDQGSGAGVVWRTDLPAVVRTPFNVLNNTLYVGIGDGADARLLTINRSDPNSRQEFADPQSTLQMPAIGGSLVYVGADRLWAIDAVTLETIWARGDVLGVQTAPVFSGKGVRALSELYVADQNLQVWALDGATGGEVWRNNVGQQVIGMAVNETSLFVAMPGQLRALNRQDGSVRWNVGTNGSIVGAPIVSGDRVIAVSQTGGIQVLDANSGASIDASAAVPAQVVGSPAVSGPYLYAPAANNTVYAFKGP